MAHPHGIQQMAEPIDNVPLLTLGSRTALQLSNDFTSIAATFLMRRIRYFLMLHSVTTDEGPFIVGVARGDATVAEIAAAILEGNTVGPSDTTQMLQSDTPWAVAQNSVELLFPADSLGQYHTRGGWKKIGIPWPEGTGWQLFVMNLDGDALITGSEMQGLVQTQGVWLRD